MPCERYRNALTDAAAGGPLPAALEAHLATCPACVCELEALREALRLADASLHALASEEPSPDLAARIRQAAAEPTPSGSWRGAAGWWAVAAVAAVLLLALALGRGTGKGPVELPARLASEAGGTPPAAAASSVARSVIPRDSVPAGPEGSAVPPAAPSRVGPGAQPRDHEPEVLVPPGEGEVLLRFVALVHRQGLAPPSLAAVGEPSADMAELASIDIKPLEIVPLDAAESSGT